MSAGILDARTALADLRAARGRPRRPDEAELKEAICQLVAQGMTRLDACEALDVPFATISQWLYDDSDFADIYARARVEQAHALADHAVAVSRRSPNGDMAEVQRQRLEVDTIKWLTSKIAPKLYGERILNEHRHTVGVVMLPALESTPELDPAKCISPASE